MDAFKLSTIVLGVICILLLVALTVVSIELGICRHRVNIPFVFTGGSLKQTPPMSQADANKQNSTLAHLAQVKNAVNLADNQGMFWVQGTSPLAAPTAVTVTIQGQKVTLGGDSANPLHGLIPMFG